MGFKGLSQGPTGGIIRYMIYHDALGGGLKWELLGIPRVAKLYRVFFS